MSQSFKFLIFAVVLSVIYFNTATGKTEDTDNEKNTTENSNDTIPQDLYVIKTVVYEVGILTDAGNDTNSNETHEQIDVSFYDPSQNGSEIDLSHIPVPIQTNVSGVTVTGLIPGLDLSSILLPPSLNSGPVLPQKQITVTQNISTKNPNKGSEIISNLPKLLGLTKNESKEKDEETTRKEKS